MLRRSVIVKYPPLLVDFFILLQDQTSDMMKESMILFNIIVGINLLGVQIYALLKIGFSFSISNENRCRWRHTKMNRISEDEADNRHFVTQLEKGRKISYPD